MKAKNKTTANQGDVLGFLAAVENEKRRVDSEKMLEDVDEEVLKELITQSYNYMTEKYG